MKAKTKKELLMILILTVVFGSVSYVLAQLLDGAISDIKNTRYQIDELTRYAADKETRIEEFESVSSYTEIIEESLPETEDIIEVLEQLENIAHIAGTSLSIGLEEGVIGEEGVEFEDEKEKEDFLKSLEVKEYEATDTTVQDTTASGQPQNAALQMMESAASEEEEFKINYLEIDLSLKGTYDQIRTYVSMLHESKYFFDIKELRLVKLEEGQISGTLGVRAFIFEK